MIFACSNSKKSYYDEIGELNDKIENISLQLEEHSEYRLINSLSDLDGEKTSPFLLDVFNNDLGIEK